MLWRSPCRCAYCNQRAASPIEPCYPLSASFLRVVARQSRDTLSSECVLEFQADAQPAIVFSLPAFHWRKGHPVQADSCTGSNRCTLTKGSEETTHRKGATLCDQHFRWKS